MNSKLISLILLTLCLGGLLIGPVHFELQANHNKDETNLSNINSSSNANNIPTMFYKLNTSYADFSNPTILSVNTDNDVSKNYITQTSYQIYEVNLTKGYYLNLTLFSANWNYTVNSSGNLTNYVVDVDLALFFGNSTNSIQYSWMNVSSNNMDEVLTTQIPLTGYYFIVVYPFESDTLTYGTEISNVLLTSTPTYNKTIYGDGGQPVFANILRIQMIDDGAYTYQNSLDVTLANTTDILSHMPTLHPGRTTWLWEHNKFGLPVNDLYKIFLPANTTVTIDVLYGSGSNVVTTSTVDKYEEVISLIHYNRYLDYLNGSYSGVYNQSGLNDAGGAGAPMIFASQIYNYVTPAESDSYYIFAINSSKLNVNTFEYNITITVTDYIDTYAPTQNNIPGTAFSVSKLLNFTLFTNNADPDYFVLTPTSQPLRLTVNIFFDRNYGTINLYVFNRSLGTYPNDDSKSLVGKSTYSDQNQQTVVYNVFDLNNIFIKVNSSAQYSNAYQLNITLGPIDDQYEPNNGFLTPATLYNPGEYKLFMAKGDYDFFRMFLFKTDKLNVTINFIGSSANLNLLLYDEQLTPLGSSTQASSDNESVEITATKNGYYYFAIYGLPASFLTPGIDYNMTIKITELDDYFEQNDNKDQSKPIQDGTFSLISRAGDEDWFNIY